MRIYNLSEIGFTSMKLPEEINENTSFLFIFFPGGRQENDEKGNLKKYLSKILKEWPSFS